MFRGIEFKLPIFEIGLKGYLYGNDAVQLAVAADKVALEYGVTIIFSPQHVDIPKIADATEHIHVFAQHMDSIPIGRGNGRILPESIKQAGAVGTLLNHCEFRLGLHEIAETIQRADEVGLATLVCADSPQEAAAIAQFHPNMILAEPPDLIGTDNSVASVKQDFVKRTMELVREIDSDITVFCSAGIRTPENVADIVRLGVEATGATSGIVKASDPIGMMRCMIKTMKETWNEMNK